MIFARFQRPDYGSFSQLHRLASFHDELRNLFQEAWGQGALATAGQFADGSGPALDLYENNDSLTVKLEAPGARKEDIAISLDEGTLTISGERKQDAQFDAATVCRCERVLGKFERQVTLPYPVDPEKIKATYTDGVLTVTLAKAEEAKLKQIPIDIK
jgi:HSP20 family protein